MLSLWKKILALALPSIATFSSMTFTGMITLIIVGGLGPDAIAVVGISNIVMYNFWALFAGVNESVNYLVSQNFGEGTMRQGNQRTQWALLLSIGLALLLAASSPWLGHDIFRWLGVHHALVDLGGPYLAARMMAFSFSLLSAVFYAYMRGVGDTRTPMYISLATNGLLVLLTYGLTYGHLGLPRTGLIGAGWSMAVTEGLGLVVSALVFYGPYHRRFQTRRLVPMERTQWQLIARESGKLSAMELSMSLAMLVFTACITQLGTVAIAANEIALNIWSLGFMPANGFGAAATIAVGQEVGAGRPLIARRAGLHTVILGLLFMGLFSLFLFLFAHPVARLYTSDPTVYQRAARLIHIAAFIQLFDGAGVIFAGALRGAGDTTFLFRASALLNWLIFVPFTLLASFVWHWGQAGAWLGLCLLIVLLGIANGWRYLALGWEWAVGHAMRPVADVHTSDPAAE